MPPGSAPTGEAGTPSAGAEHRAAPRPCAAVAAVWFPRDITGAVIAARAERGALRGCPCAYRATVRRPRGPHPAPARSRGSRTRRGRGHPALGGRELGAPRGQPAAPGAPGQRRPLPPARSHGPEKDGENLRRIEGDGNTQSESTTLVFSLTLCPETFSLLRLSRRR